MNHCVDKYGTRVVVLGVSAFLACFSSACGGTGNDLSLAVVSDSSGVAIVWNPMVPVWEESPIFTEELRIGDGFGDSEYQFARVGAIDFDDEGLIYVLDRASQHVRVFDERGEFRNYISGPGQGPAELGPGATPVMVWKDIVLVPDFDSFRVKRFTRDGDATGTLRFSPDERIGAGWGVSWERTNGGEVLQQIRTRGPGPSFDPRDLLLRWDLQGEIADTVLAFPTQAGIGIGGARVTFRIFAPKMMWAVTADDRVLLANTSSPRIEIWSLEGELDRVVEMDVDSIVLSEEQVRDAAPEVPEGLSEYVAYEVAPNLPILEDIIGGPRGTIWARIVEGVSGRELLASWHVFDRGGQYLGVASLPDGFTPLRVMGDSFLGVQVGDYDIPYVVRLRMESVSRW